MPTLYDSYQLANSRMIPEYVGSTLPELRHANASRQEQFNVGKEYADMIDQAVKTATASSYDQPVLDQLKEDYRDRLKGYAEKGDYENMWRNVAMDARDFVGKYKPIAQNQQNISKHFSELEDRVAKGEVSKSDYEAEVRRVQDTYTGLQKDLATGQYKNQFSGKPLVKAPDFIAKINAILTNTDAIERGWKVTGMSADNDYIISNGGRTEILPWKSVKQYIDAGMAIDPDVQSYISQQRELAPYKYGFSNRISEEQAMNAMIGNKTPAEVGQIEAARQGRSWKDTLKDSLTDAHLQNLQAGIYGLGQKGIIDKRTSERSATLSSVGSDRIKRKEEDEVLALTADVWQPDRSTAYTPNNLDGKITELQTGFGNLVKDYDSWHAQNGITAKDVNGVKRHYDKDGNDISDIVRKRNDVIQQTATTVSNLQSFRDKAMKETQFVITPELKQKAQEAEQKARITYNTKVEGTAARTYSQTEIDQKAKEAYDKVLENSPGYKRYETKLKEYANSNQLVGIQTFTSKAANTQAEHYFKGLALDLDPKGVKYGALGLQWATGLKAGNDLVANDYKKIKEAAQFIGVGIDTDGQYKMYYKTGVAKDGESVVVKMAALPGTSEMLIKSGQITQAEQFLAQGISNLPATGKLQIGDNLFVDVDKQPNGSYQLKFPTENGRSIIIQANSRGEAVSSIANALQNMIKRK